jgi:hypothetical protein
MRLSWINGTPLAQKEDANPSAKAGLDGGVR